MVSYTNPSGLIGMLKYDTAESESAVSMTPRNFLHFREIAALYEYVYYSIWITGPGGLESWEKKGGGTKFRDKRYRFTNRFLRAHCPYLVAGKKTNISKVFTV